MIYYTLISHNFKTIDSWFDELEVDGKKKET